MKRAGFALVLALALVLPACDDENDTPAAPSSPTTTPTAPSGPPLAPTNPPAGTNEPPVLRFNINPDQPSGPLPREVTVNMCGSTDPDGEPIVYEYKWGGGAQHFSYFCRSSHVYETAGSYRAFFCAHDEHDHQSCVNQRIDITP